MGRSRERKEKHEKGSELSEQDCNEGTAARTRPISYEEIMLKRESKKLPVSDEVVKQGVREVKDSSSRLTEKKLPGSDEIVKGVREVKDSSSRLTEKKLPGSDEIVKQGVREVKDSSSRLTEKKPPGSDEVVKQGDREVEDSSSRFTENASTTHEPERTYRRSKDSSGGRKNKSEEIGMKSSRIGVEKTSLRSTIHKQKDHDIIVSDKQLKAERSKEPSTVDKERSKKPMRQSRKNENSTDYLKNLYEKNVFEDLAVKDRQRDRKEKVEKASKRSHRNGDDEKKGGKDAMKKHDLGKERGSVIPDRNERKETFESQYDKQRHKRGRSRSRDREDQHKRSPSPREHKRTTHHVKDHEVSSHSLKDRSKRHQSDIDRSRLTNNSSSSSRKRHGDSTSGLGGYSPRKKRTEAAAKTPSPSYHSPEKRTAKWDVGPSGADKIMSGSVSSKLQTSNLNQKTSSNAQEVTNAAPKFMAMSNAFAAMSANSLSSKPKVSIDSVQLTEATRPMRRLYIENVPASASDKDLREFLNSFLLSAGINHVLGTQPCISCSIHKEKRQALAEFLTPEDTSAALSLDGGFFSGSILKMRRPKDYVEVTAELEISKPEVAVVNDVVKDSPHKIFVGGISKVLSSEMFKEIASSFGPLKLYHFEINADFNEPCAFLEYADQSVTLKARAGLNGMKLGGQVITAVQVVPNASYLDKLKGGQPFYGIPELARPLLEKPTQVLKLKNLFNIEGFSSMSEAEVEEVLDDVRQECVRFGAVKSIHVVKDTTRIFLNRGTNEATEDMEHVRAKLNLGTEETHVEKEAIEEFPHEKPRITSGVESLCDAEQVWEKDELLEDKSIKNDKPAADLMDKKSGELGELGATISVEDVVRVKMEVEVHQTVVDPDCGNVSVSDFQELPNPSSTLKLEVAEKSCMEASNVEVKTTAEGLNSEDVKLLETDAGFAGNAKLESDTIVKDETEENAAESSSLGTGVEDLNPEEVDAKSIETDIVSAGKVEMVSDVKEKDDDKEQESYLRQVFELGSVFVEFRRTESSCTAAHSLHGRLFDDRKVTVDYVEPEHYRKVFPK